MDLCSWIGRDFERITGFRPMEVLIGLSGEDQRRAIEFYNELGQKYADEANRRINEAKREFEESLNRPEWAEIYDKVENPQQFLSILNEAGRRNGNEIPQLLASDNDYFHLRLSNSDEMLSIAKQGDYIRLSPLGDASMNFGLGKIQSQVAGFGDNFREISLQDVFLGGGVQYNLRADGSFSRYSFFNDEDWSVGTRNYVKVNLIDITQASAPRLAVGEDNTFYFQGLNKTQMNVGLKGGASITNLMSVWGDASTDGTFSASALAATVSHNHKTNERSVGAGASAGVAEVMVEAGFRTYDQPDIKRLLNQLPADVENKLYDAFLNNDNPNLRNFETCSNRGVHGELICVSIPDEDLRDAKRNLENQMNERKNNDVRPEAPRPFLPESQIQPCRM